MNFGDLIKDDRIRHGASVFASLYAKRLLERHYDETISTSLGQKLYRLDRPTKLGIEAALYAVTAYLVRNEDPRNGPPWKSFLLELLKDAPAEFSKRMLNGEPAVASAETNLPETGALAALEALQGVSTDTLNELAAHLRTLDQEGRRKFANQIAALVEQEVSRDRAAEETQQSCRTPGTGKHTPSLTSHLASSLRSINERLENRGRRRQ
jgi:hypothetical protein